MSTKQRNFNSIISAIIFLQRNGSASKTGCTGTCSCKTTFHRNKKSIGTSNAKDTITLEAYERITEILHIDNDFNDFPVNDRKSSVRLNFPKRLMLISNG